MRVLKNFLGIPDTKSLINWKSIELASLLTIDMKVSDVKSKNDYWHR